MTETGMKTAYEVALEKLEERGIKKPSQQALTEEARAGVAEIRSRAKAELANLEILHRSRVTQEADPAARQQDEQNYQSERARIESRRDRDITKLRKS